MRKISFAIFFLLTLTAAAEESIKDEIINLRAEARLDYQRDWLDGNTVDNNSGFEGKYINLRVDGNITGNLSYSWRQRLNKHHNDGNFFDATDWLYLNYNYDKWSFAGGKQIVAIGGWEYDRAPIDLYGCSVFWNNIPCYEIGASAAYHFTPGNTLSFQFCESPFFTKDNRNLYAYNLMWSGNHGIFKTLYSVNLIEYRPKHYINYIALGNKVEIDAVTLELDLMNRASSHQQFFFKDMSVMGEISYTPAPKWRFFGKMTYDVNHSGTDADATVHTGTEMKMAGIGVEFFPIKDHRQTLRFHANAFYSWGKNANTADVMQNKTTIIDVGVKWHMNLFSLKR